MINRHAINIQIFPLVEQFCCTCGGCGVLSLNNKYSLAPAFCSVPIKLKKWHYESDTNN